jgi:hypothetical protein
MWDSFAVGVGLNLSIVATNYVLFFAKRRKDSRLLKLAVIPLLGVIGFSVPMAIWAYQGISSTQQSGYLLSMPVLLLGVPLVLSDLPRIRHILFGR